MPSPRWGGPRPPDGPKHGWVKRVRRLGGEKCGGNPWYSPVDVAIESVFKTSGNRYSQQLETCREWHLKSEVGRAKRSTSAWCWVSWTRPIAPSTEFPGAVLQELDRDAIPENHLEEIDGLHDYCIKYIYIYISITVQPSTEYPDFMDESC